MIVVVGAGLSGATMAERFAAQLGQRVLVVDKRPYVGGNCYDYLDEQGLLIPKYGPHFFHTNDHEVRDYLSRFTGWRPYEHRVLASVDGRLVPVPVNRRTINELIGAGLETADDVRAWLERHAEKRGAPKNSEEAAVARVGRTLYEKLFRGYTRKQWDLDASSLAPSVLERIPVHYDDDDRYFTDSFQAMPADGYTAMIQRMLSHPLIETRLGTDYFEIRSTLPAARTTVFTGEIDVYFADSGYERLEYRSLRFELERLPIPKFQPVAQVNYPGDEPFTRITEPKHATGQESAGTTIIREYPVSVGEPYYPVPRERNAAIYAKYLALAEREKEKDVHFVGRLANYRYINMDQTVRNALNAFAAIGRKVVA
jgi:UDP-galactopyranose mutase